MDDRTLAAPTDRLRRFVAAGRFGTHGALITDLDGTAVLEREGRIYLPPDVESGLAHIRARGRPVIANTLRFPLSVIRVFGDEWHRATGADLPLVSMKGSQIGCVRRAGSSTVFDEWDATPLDASEIDEVLEGVRGLVDDDVDDLLVFHYPRDWTRGERIWTPAPDRLDAARAKYRSATDVTTGPFAAFADVLRGSETCMVFLLIEVPEDRRMAYQHTERARFFTHRGVDKKTGAERIARRLGIDLAASIGAGDAPPDEFLNAVGFAIVVGGLDVPHRGLADTARVDDVAALGRLLAVVGDAV